MTRKKGPGPETEEPPKDAGANGTTPSVASTNGEKNMPTFKVGPIATDRNNAVTAAVWENEVATTEGRIFKVHNVTVEARYYDAQHLNEDGSTGKWKSGKSFRGSQLYALMYCLQRASDFILSQRDPQNDCPF